MSQVDGNRYNKQYRYNLPKPLANIDIWKHMQWVKSGTRSTPHHESHYLYLDIYVYCASTLWAVRDTV